jgi:MFS family permease
VGLVTTALASVVFGVADIAWVLGAARFVQGFGSALSWAGALAWLVTSAPRERRAEMIGTAMGVAIAGAVLGPVLGATADVVGAGLAFGGVAAMAGVCAATALRMPGPPPSESDLSTLARGARDPQLLGGLWLVTLPALLFGVVAVLVPLELHELGWSAVAIGGLWLGTAVVESVMNPLLGRFVDRRGRRLPVRLALVGSVAVCIAFAWAGTALAVAVLVVAGGIAFGALFTPGLAIVSEGADHVGVAQALAFGVMNAAWAVGNLVGPAAGGALAGATSDAVAYLAAAALCGLTLLAVARPRPPVPGCVGRRLTPLRAGEERAAERTAERVPGLDLAHRL